MQLLSARRVALTLLAASTALAARTSIDGEWPHWRGPEGTGVASGSAPLEWSDEKNVKWKIAVPGRGFSTPIVWGQRIFLTTAVPTGKEPEGGTEPEPEPEPPQPPEGERRGRGGRGGRGGPGGASGPQVEQAFVVLCLDRQSGKELWRETANVATPHEGYHRTYGSFASASPVTDGERLYVSFGSWGLYCYDLEGELVWKKDPGVQMRMRNSFGEGLAPVLAGDVLVQVYDQEGDSFVVALNKETGEELWRKDRDEPTSWATPLVTEHDGVLQVITSATNRVRSYDPKTGEVLWECGGLGLNAIPAPLRFEDTVIAMSGYRESNCMAIELGHEGDLTGTEAVKWSTQKGLSYTASPVLHEGKVYAAMDRGFMSCFDAKTGEAHYREERLPQGSTLKASPVVAGERLYQATESGDVHVLKLGPELEVLATNSLADQFFVASPVVVDGRILLRSSTHLFCIGE